MGLLLIKIEFCQSFSCTNCSRNQINLGSAEGEDLLLPLGAIIIAKLVGNCHNGQVDVIEIVEYILNFFGAPVLAMQVNDYSAQLARVSSAACISATGITSRPDGNMVDGLRQPSH